MRHRTLIFFYWKCVINHYSSDVNGSAVSNAPDKIITDDRFHRKKKLPPDRIIQQIQYSKRNIQKIPFNPHRNPNTNDCTKHAKHTQTAEIYEKRSVCFPSNICGFLASTEMKNFIMSPHHIVLLLSPRTTPTASRM